MGTGGFCRTVSASATSDALGPRDLLTDRKQLLHLEAGISTHIQGIIGAWHREGHSANLHTQ